MRDSNREDRLPPLIVHVIFRLAVGGLENGLVNLINRLPREFCRHAIVCMTDHTDFSSRIQRPDVEVYDLHKRPGKDFGIYIDLWKLFRTLKPDIVHTRNLSAMEAQLPAFMAGVPCRIHAEHGRDVHDLDGSSRKYALLRRAVSPVIDRYIALSHDLQQYLLEKVRVPPGKITVISNGVDIDRFTPADCGERQALPGQMGGKDSVIIGTVGRMEAVKDQLTLVRAFIELAGQYPAGGVRPCLVMIGDGTLRQPALQLLHQAGMDNIAWLPGACDNIPELLQNMDVFVLPSLAEGISNTILEAMASSLPVVATDVGGSGELVAHGRTGFLVPRSDPAALAVAMRRYIDDPVLRRAHGAAARRRCEELFSIEVMVNKYMDFYGNLLTSVGRDNRASASWQ
ncbi:MAG: TIGR03088 family PEP-CTERM/XrtA system glycosyltransferase [Gammaproteobacteria bacterium]